MHNSFIIEQGLGEWRAATIGADGFPEDIHFLSGPSLSAVDVVFRARVTEVNPSLDMAFFDLGSGRQGCMSLRRAKQLVKGRVNSISDCLTEGQTLLVQGVADPSALEQKAIQLSAKPRLVGRFVVVEQAAPRLFFSKDLPPRTQKLLAPVLTDVAARHSVIVRTAACDQPVSAVAAEAAWLASAFDDAHSKGKPGVVFALTPLEQALMSAPDQQEKTEEDASEGKIMIASGTVMAEAKKLCADRWPDLVDRLSLWNRSENIFEEMGVEEAVEEALADQINLPSGGWITIEETKALTVIDVNVGSALQGRPAAEALLTVNMEAALAALYHLRFQDIGGLIVIDFVDMSAKGSAAELVRVIDEAIKDDPVPVRRSGLSQFGLMELSRRRKGLSLRQRMQRRRGPVTAGRAVALDLLRQAEKVGLSKGAGDLILTLPAGGYKFLEEHKGLVVELEQRVHRTCRLVQGDRPHAQLK